MKRTFFSLPVKLFLGVIAGIVLGLYADETTMKVVVTFKYILGQLIFFCVPLIIIGFIAPSITKLGQNASKILLISVSIAYLSSLGAALFATFSGYTLIPLLDVTSSADGLKEVPEIAFKLSIPALMSVMSALVFSILVGLAAAWTKAKVITALLDEFQQIILKIVVHIIIPILPFFIAATFCVLSYEGSITEQFPLFVKVIAIVMIGHFVWLALLYFLAGLYARKNPLKVLKNYGPAYITAVGTMSSAATLAVSLRCAKKSSPPLQEDMVNFSIPLFANIHLCGSVLTEVFFVMSVSAMLYGGMPDISTMMLFCVLLGVFAIGAPGVPGGTVMASLGLIIGILGFDETGTALMLTIFALQDSFGTACNVTGDGALCLGLSGYVEKHGFEGLE